MKANLKVGDKIKVKRFKVRPEGWNDAGKMDHLMGKIVEVRDVLDLQNVNIYDELHDRIWYLRRSEFEPVDKRIVIYRKDNKVIAKDVSTGKTAVAKCCQEDTFDFNTGARLAFDRLTESEKKPLNAKIIFTKGDNIFKIGRIYEIKDGQINRNGILMPGPYYSDGLFTSIEDVKDFFTKTSERKRVRGWSNKTLEFIEVVDD